jgi:ketopantoate reductase
MNPEIALNERHCVKHAVYFRNLNPNTEKLVIEVKEELLLNKALLKIQNLWFGKKTDRNNGYDSIFRARLKVDVDFDYFLIVEFLSHDDLNAYYSNDIHCNIRKKLYRNLCEGLQILYNLLDASNVSEEKKTKLFEDVIEEIISRYMSRRDYIEIDNG